MEQPEGPSVYLGLAGLHCPAQSGRTSLASQLVGRSPWEGVVVGGRASGVHGHIAALTLS